MLVRNIEDTKALEAVTYLLRWMGEDPNREGLKETPERVLKAWANEFFCGYGEDPKAHLSKVFEETEGYNSLVLLKDITFHSYCEHHLVPIVGTAHIGYIPNKHVVGISKLARVLEVYAKRLQVQERLTEQVANAINEILSPKGVAVVVTAQHMCMSTRGVNKTTSAMSTSSMRGEFINNAQLREEFYRSIG